MLTSTVCQPPMPADVIANALLGKGIGNILFPRTVGFPHCLQRYNKPVKITTCGLICINVYNNRSWRHTFNPDISCSIAVCQTCKARQRIYYRQRQYDYILFSCPTIKSPLWLAPNYNPVNIIRLGYIRSIWLICTSCNSSIRCRTSRAAPFARSRCNCKEHVCKWYW